MIKLRGSRGINWDISRRQFIKYGSMALGTGTLAACVSNIKTTFTNSASNPKTKGGLDRVIFNLSWVAEAEYGGFYQALATGIYQDYGLDVTIKQGSPRGNYNLLLMGGAVDLTMANGAEALNSVKDALPKVTVAAIFQRDPQVLMAHPGTGNDSLDKLKGKSILVAAAADANYWPFLKVKYGFTDDQKRPYNFDIQPFLKDKNIIQQGIITAEPFDIKKKGGFDPVVMLLADYGYNPYNFTVDTTKALIEKSPNLIERFVDASIKGWYSYLEEPIPGNKLIKQANSAMTDEQISFSIQKMKESGLIMGGDAEQLGIGAMTAERWKSFFNNMVEAGVFDKNLNYKDAFTLQFVNKGVGYYKS